MLGSKFVTFLMSVLNWQVSSSSIFATSFIVMAHNSPVNFKLIYFQLWTKESHQSPNFETFKCSGENLPNSSCYFPNHKLVFLQILHHSLVSWKITSLGQRLPERTFWDFWVLGSKFTKFLSFLKQQISFLSIFFSQSWVPSNITSLCFLSWSIIYFGQKKPIKVQIFEIVEYSGQNVLNSSCQFWTSLLGWKFTKFLSVLKQQVSFSSNSGSIFSVKRRNSSVLFQLKFYILSTKGTCQGTNLVELEVWSLSLWWTPFLKII